MKSGTMTEVQSLHTGNMSDRISNVYDKRERKKQLNRIAQRNYRRNQRNRIQALEALEAAVSSHRLSNISNDTGLTSPISPNLISMVAPPTNDIAGRAAVSFPEDVFLPMDCINFDAEPALSPPSCSRTTSGSGQTSLHRAVYGESESIVRILLDRGADVTKRDSNGNTALHIAAANRDIGQVLVKLLLDRSADSNAQDVLGQTALFAAVQNGNEEVVKLLLESSVDVNLKDSMGNVALHCAVEEGAESIVLLLLNNGADINA